MKFFKPNDDGNEPAALILIGNSSTPVSWDGLWVVLADPPSKPNNRCSAHPLRVCL